MPNKDVFIIGGGPSLTGFDFSVLKGRDTIAVNVSALDVPDPTYCITADSGIFRRLQQGAFKKIKTTWVLVTNPNHCSMKWRDGRFIQESSGYVHNLFAANMVIKNAGVEGIGFSFDDFRTGYNSGFCAFQLAVLLGYENIYLLGFDLRNAGSSHYHNEYGPKQIPASEFDKFYRNWLISIPKIKKYTTINVFSCSKTSRLNKLIKYKSIDKVLKTEDAMNAQVREKFMLENEVILSKIVSSSPKFSILICSLGDRANLLNDLLLSLQEQWDSDVEVLVDVDNGEITTGAKRNRLLEKARGEYVAFIDDDDNVPDYYIAKILGALEEEPDVVGFLGQIHQQTRRRIRRFIHSIDYKDWHTKDNVYYRCPNHLNPVKRELALKVKFKDVTRGEDKDYSHRLYSLLESEEFIDETMYYYMTG